MSEEDKIQVRRILYDWHWPEDPTETLSLICRCPEYVVELLLGVGRGSLDVHSNTIFGERLIVRAPALENDEKFLMIMCFEKRLRMRVVLSRARESSLWEMGIHFYRPEAIGAHLPLLTEIFDGNEDIEFLNFKVFEDEAMEEVAAKKGNARRLLNLLNKTQIRNLKFLRVNNQEFCLQDEAILSDFLFRYPDALPSKMDIGFGQDDRYSANTDLIPTQSVNTSIEYLSITVWTTQQFALLQKYVGCLVNLHALCLVTHHRGHSQNAVLYDLTDLFKVLLRGGIRAIYFAGDANYTLQMDDNDDLRRIFLDNTSFDKVVLDHLENKETKQVNQYCRYFALLNRFQKARIKDLEISRSGYLDLLQTVNHSPTVESTAADLRGDEAVIATSSLEKVSLLFDLLCANPSAWCATEHG